MSKDNKNQEQRPSIFDKMLEAGSSLLEAQIQKSKAEIMNQVEDPEEFQYAKALTEDPQQTAYSNGWKDKYHRRLTNTHLRQMATQDVAVVSVIKTFQNKAAAHACLVNSENQKGFMIKLKNEDKLLEEIKEQIKNEQSKEEETEKSEKLLKTDEGEVDKQEIEQESDSEDKARSKIDDDDIEEYDWELERKARARMHEMYKKNLHDVQNWVLNCGSLEKSKRPFEHRRWNFEQALRAWVWDSCVYDLYSREMVPDRAGRPSYWFPVDGGTIKYASPQLKNFKSMAETFQNVDYLYPEKDVQEKVESKLELDEELLEKEAYRYVQVVRGKIERAYTSDELAVGIRNLLTDIWNNGYGLSELELAIGLVTGHLNAEFYNQAYFQQGFSAKGILHIKANINRRKMETIRQQWQHLLKGSRNSFQTPIFSGANDVEWIPLTQNHQDIGFEGWMRYLIKMICARYQIDPDEVGINLKGEGKSEGLSGDNTEERLKESKERGLFPMMRHLQNFINTNIIAPFDDRFELVFTGITTETQTQTLDRQEKEVKFKKTVNEIRAEDNLPPMPGMDDVILDPTYMQWYTQYSKKAQETAEQNMVNQEFTQGGAQEPTDPDQAEVTDQDLTDLEQEEEEVSEDEQTEKSLKKSRLLKIERYDLGE
jgi:hypothetical protein